MTTKSKRRAKPIKIRVGKDIDLKKHADQIITAFKNNVKK